MGFSKFSFNPADGLRNVVQYPTVPASEAEAREQIQGRLDEIKNYLNNILTSELDDHTHTKTQITDFAHKLTHASDGADALTPADIGAASSADLAAHLAEKVQDNTKDPHGIHSELLQRAVNVVWFGAKCDGVTDDTQAVLAAINYLAQQPRIEYSRGAILIPPKCKYNRAQVNSTVLPENVVVLDFSGGGNNTADYPFLTVLTNYKELSTSQKVNNLKFEAPYHPAIVVDNTGDETVEKRASIVFRHPLSAQQWQIGLGGVVDATRPDLVIDNGASGFVIITQDQKISILDRNVPLNGIEMGTIDGNVRFENRNTDVAKLIFNLYRDNTNRRQVIFDTDDSIKITNQGATGYVVTISSDGRISVDNGISNNGVLWLSGIDSPEGVVTAPVGSIYTRKDGGTGTTLYVKESGTGNTGWVAHLDETLQQGVHSIATTADITLYVDATNGNDNNPGTDTQPLKTIQAAINKIPQIVNHTVTINVAAGTYNENVTIQGFVGKGSIFLLGGTDLTSSANYVITGKMSIYSCSCYVYIRGFKFTGAILSDAVYGFIETRRCIHTAIIYCTLDGSNVSFDYERGVVTFYAKTRITGSSISNMAGTSQGVAIYATDLSEIYSDSNEGSDNSIALYASAGIIRKYGTQPSGTTQETTNAGGQIL